MATLIIIAYADEYCNRFYAVTKKYLKPLYISCFLCYTYRIMTKDKIFEFIKEQKTAFLSTVDENGFPVTRAMLAPRKFDGNAVYFSTNTSSRKVAQLSADSKACVYFYKRGRFKYTGVTLLGTAEICTDQPTKDEIWRVGDGMFYKKGKTDPDYCVIKFTAIEAEYYCDLKVERIVL